MKYIPASEVEKGLRKLDADSLAYGGIGFNSLEDFAGEMRALLASAVELPEPGDRPCTMCKGTGVMPKNHDVDGFYKDGPSVPDDKLREALRALIKWIEYRDNFASDECACDFARAALRKEGA